MTRMTPLPAADCFRRTGRTVLLDDLGVHLQRPFPRCTAASKPPAQGGAPKARESRGLVAARSAVR
ncbi:hypothetical protein [Kitasatospora azatica]|uniref:hypothetical protein n=1 Tax=Kitasatospora azatica TaxID=58347 RepID=UPI00055E939B|nr:hypothetical protein [Kitasatospora azatica]